MRGLVLRLCCGIVGIVLLWPVLRLLMLLRGLLICSIRRRRIGLR